MAPKKTPRGVTVFEFVVLDPEWGNHWHDCEQYAMVAADMLGIRSLPEKVPQRKKAAPKREPKMKIRRRQGSFVRRR
jgi:hypothetical protein